MTPPPLPPSGPPGPPQLPPVPPAIPLGAPAWQPPLTASPPPRRTGTRPVFWIILAVIALGFIALVVAGGSSAYNKIISGVKAKQAQEEIRKLSAAANQEMLAELEASGEINGEQSVARMEKVGKLLEASATGNDPASMESRAAAAWSKRILAATKSHTEATQALQNPAILDAASLQSKEEIARRRQVMEKFAQANQQLTDIFQNAVEDFTEELRKQGMDASLLPKHSAGFSKGIQRQHPFITTIRKADAGMVTAVYEWLDLVEQEWGAWEVDDEENLTFKNPEAQEKWIALSEKLSQHAEDQAEAQKGLLEMQSQRNP